MISCTIVPRALFCRSRAPATLIYARLLTFHARLSNQMKKYRKLHSRANAILRLDFHASAGNWVLDIAMSARWISMQGKETNYKPEDFFAMLFLSNLLQTLKVLIIIQKEKFKFIYILIFFFFTWYWNI